MRTEAEMLDLIIQTAKNDERVRAVQIQGSRTNPNTPRDRFQDYDICYYVRNIESFLNNPDWIDLFGERLMLQTLKINELIFLYSMLFTDGNRIDLVLLPEEYGTGESVSTDNEAEWLYTKDSAFMPRLRATHERYNIKPPTEAEYNEACNQFWWHTQYVAKGIARDELPYAAYFFHIKLRENLNRMIAWYIGQKNNFSVSAGKYEKYMKNFLTAHQYERVCKTYAGGDYGEMKAALFLMCEIFREYATEVAAHNHFTYPAGDSQNMTKYLKTQTF
jgi:aminoglycoside 6-adenylyltransferase